MELAQIKVGTGKPAASLGEPLNRASAIWLYFCGQTPDGLAL